MKRVRLESNLQLSSEAKGVAITPFASPGLRSYWVDGDLQSGIVLILFSIKMSVVINFC